MLPQSMLDRQPSLTTFVMTSTLQHPSIVPECEGIWGCPLPGVKCPTCAEEGKEVWVIPGRACGYCSTPAPSQSLAPNIQMI
ncbi:hypothetical protein B0T17DRAFT_185433 [Bombardia bombarda]|uniref:Uncharacterized protein n=1 Tax=Bombardia bombarda TaxID=252184 RepID=A0AA39X8R4_9PEZI|nr:hypothetical protein B0T17DRAFT_185433 [Bombardia bombarda]